MVFTTRVVADAVSSSSQKASSSPVLCALVLAGGASWRALAPPPPHPAPAPLDCGPVRPTQRRIAPDTASGSSSVFHARASSPASAALACSPLACSVLSQALRLAASFFGSTSAIHAASSTSAAYKPCAMNEYDVQAHTVYVGHWHRTIVFPYPVVKSNQVQVAVQ